MSDGMGDGEMYEVPLSEGAVPSSVDRTSEKLLPTVNETEMDATGLPLG